MRNTILIIAILAGQATPATARPVEETAEVTAALAAPGRPAAYVALDEVRRPAEILAFFGLKRGDRVLDYGAGGGYYAEIAARAVGPRGLVIGWNPPPFAARENVRTALAAIQRRNPNAAFYATPSSALSFPGGSFDFVLLHLSYHDSYWQDEDTPFGFERVAPGYVAGKLFAATRPGGTLAVVDHVAKPGRDTRAEVAATHRIDPAVVRADFERAGFVFEAESPLLRNSADDHGKRVFDRAIRGRTDRFVFRFRKPGEGRANR